MGELWDKVPPGFFSLGCRLCGEIWKFPLSFKATLEEQGSWECPYCRRGFPRNVVDYTDDDVEMEDCK